MQMWWCIWQKPLLETQELTFYLALFANFSPLLILVWNFNSVFFNYRVLRSFVWRYFFIISWVILYLSAKLREFWLGSNKSIQNEEPCSRGAVKFGKLHSLPLVQNSCFGDFWDAAPSQKWRENLGLWCRGRCCCLCGHCPGRGADGDNLCCHQRAQAHCTVTIKWKFWFFHTEMPPPAGSAWNSWEPHHSQCPGSCTGTFGTEIENHVVKNVIECNSEHL